MSRHLLRLQDIINNNRQNTLGFVLYFSTGLITFFIGFLAFFPNTTLQQKLQYELNRNVPGEIAIGDTTYRFPLGLKAEEVRIKMNNRSIPAINFDSVYLTPHLASLIGKPGLSFTATTREGSITGSLTRAGAFNVDIDNYSFDEPIQGFSEIRLNGKINSASLESHLKPESDTPSKMILSASGLYLSGLRSAGLAAERIELGTLSVELSGQGRSLDFNKGSLSGGAIEAEATGQILLGRSIKSTRINLELQIKPALNLEPSVASLFELIGEPSRDGSRKLIISGALAQPRLK